MRVEASSPPCLPPPAGRSAPVAALAALLVVPLAMFLARVWLASDIPLLRCGFKSLTGYPCPGCGGTRSLDQLGRFQWTEAFVFNPLVAALAVLVFLAGAAGLLDHMASSGRLAAMVRSRLRGFRGLRWVIAGLVAANWIYLVRTLE